MTAMTMRTGWNREAWRRLWAAVLWVGLLVGCDTGSRQPDAIGASGRSGGGDLRPIPRLAGSSSYPAPSPHGEAGPPGSVTGTPEVVEATREAGVPEGGSLHFPSEEEWVEVQREPRAMGEAGVPRERARDESILKKGGASLRRPSGDTDGRAESRSLLACLSPGEELWIIQRAEGRDLEPSDRDDRPGSGALVTRIESVEVPVPLEHTDVRARVSGYVATVEVVQKFHNPYDRKIEAVYVFPLPQDAAVNEFVMTIGERKIRGIIRERIEAEKIYDRARSQGHVASLLTQERPNIFTQKVANIEPGKAIDIEIKYFNTLAYRDGSYELTFPMVVGPRFNPPGSTTGIGAVGRGSRGASGQSTEVEYLRPGERSGHDISLVAEVDAGVTVEEVACPSHAVEVRRTSDSAFEVSLSRLDAIPNRDFVLRYRVAGRRIKANLMTHRDERGGFFTLMVFPPEDLRAVQRQPVEFVFVLDCSGSMNGQPIARAKAAVERALKKLRPGDSFQVIRFSSGASRLGPRPVEATAANVQRALEYVRSLRGGGGTMMIEGIRAALDFPHDPERLRLVSFMTDGYIGNELEIFRAVHDRLGSARIFSFGVGNSVNRYLLEGLARLGKGAVAYVGLQDAGGEAIDLFYDRIQRPALTDLTVDWGDMQVEEVYPQRIPDLFVGRPVTITGRFRGDGPVTVRVRGQVGGAGREIVIDALLDEVSSSHAGIASIWARRKIADLSDRLVHDRSPELPVEIRELALDHGLLSPYTAFLAVDSSRRTSGDHGISVRVPVPVPDGVRYETTVHEGR